MTESKPCNEVILNLIVVHNDGAIEILPLLALLCSDVSHVMSLRHVLENVCKAALRSDMLHVDVRLVLQRQERIVGHHSLVRVDKAALL